MPAQASACATSNEPGWLPRMPVRAGGYPASPPATARMRACICQLNIAWEDKAANFARVEELLSQAAPPAGSLVVLPEMAFTGFSMNVAEVAKDEPERTEAFLAGLAAKLGIHLVAGVVTAAPSGRGRNEALYVSPEQGVTHRYQKLHLFSFAGEPSIADSSC